MLSDAGHCGMQRCGAAAAVKSLWGLSTDNPGLPPPMVSAEHFYIMDSHKKQMGFSGAECRCQEFSVVQKVKSPLGICRLMSVNHQKRKSV